MDFDKLERKAKAELFGLIQSKQAEVDKRLSDYQLEVSQVGQSCVKWKEIAEGKQAEIDVLKERIKVSLDWLEWSSSKNDSAVRRAISSLRGENNDT